MTKQRIAVSLGAAVTHVAAAGVLAQRRRPLIGLAVLVTGVVHLVPVLDLRNAVRAVSRRLDLGPAPRSTIDAPDRFRRVYPSRPQAAAPGFHGRQAAAVHRDEQRPYNLFAATLGMGDAARYDTTGGKRPIALIGTQALAETLSAEFTVIALRPQMTLAQLDYWHPSAIVIQRAALIEGQWGGALRATGASLMREVQQVCTWADANDTTSFLLPDGDGQLLADPVLARSVTINLATADATDAAAEWDGELPRLVQILVQQGGAQ